MKVGAWMVRHRAAVVIVWVAIAVALSVAGRLVDSQPRSSFALPGSESNDALELLSSTFPDLVTGEVTVVYQSPSGTVDDSGNAQLIEQTVQALEGLDQVSQVSSPTDVPDRFLDVSSDGTIAYSTVRLTESVSDAPPDTFDSIVGAVTPARDAGLDVELDGLIVDTQNPPRGTLSQYADVISIVVAIIIITLAFGAPIVSLMPIAVALVALSTSLSLLSLLQKVFDISSVNEVLGTMLALGVGIDYSLLVINRHRQLRAAGADVEDAIETAWATAGRAVLLAGATICAATATLFVVGVPLVSTLGFTSAMFVAVTVVTALTLLPALLGFAGTNLDRWGLPWAGARSRFWPRWAAINARHRWTFAIVPLVVLVPFVIPVPQADLGIIDDGSLPTSVTQRRAYDLIAQGFGPGANGPLLVTAAIPAGAAETDVLRAATPLRSAIDSTEGVQSVSPPKFSNRSGATADDPGQQASFVMRVIPTTGPDDEATSALVDDLRSNVVPSAVEGTVLTADDVDIGGQTAVFIDFTDRIQQRLAIYIAVVLVLAFLLLMSAFRSLLIPLIAAVMALVSFFVAYGATIAVFQWGWLKAVIGLETTVPIETFFPLMLFAILFGLSMDYMVFLVSRVHEEYEGGRAAGPAVTTGLATTGKIILSAGLIMTSVFLAFATNPSPVIKQIAFGLAFAIAVDAIIIRLVVVPAVLHVFGRASWRFPKALDRVLPHIDVG